MPPKKKRKVVPAKSPAVSNKGIVACFLQGSTTLRLAHKPGPEIRFFRAKLEGFYSAQTAQDSLECSTTMRSGFMDCAGARRENRRPLEYQRGQPAGSVWDRTSAPAAPKPAGATVFLWYARTCKGILLTPCLSYATIRERKLEVKD